MKLVIACLLLAATALAQNTAQKQLGITVTATSHYVQLNWQASTSNSGIPIIYNIYRMEVISGSVVDVTGTMAVTATGSGMYACIGETPTADATLEANIQVVGDLAQLSEAKGGTWGTSPPVINSFTSDATTPVQSGQVVNLSWAVVSAQSVFVGQVARIAVAVPVTTFTDGAVLGNHRYVYFIRAGLQSTPLGVESADSQVADVTVPPDGNTVQIKQTPGQIRITK